MWGKENEMKRNEGADRRMTSEEIGKKNAGAFKKAAKERFANGTDGFLVNREIPDAIADRINELAAEQMGDVLLEERDGIYCVLEDYLEWAIELMLQGKDDEDGK